MPGSLHHLLSALGSPPGMADSMQLKPNWSIGQGFSNFFSEGPDETPVQPERVRTVFGGGEDIFMREAHITSAKSLPGPAQGPWKLWGYRCSLMQSQPYFWTIYNLFETSFYYTECNQIEATFHIVTCKMIKKRNKQQSLAGRIDKLGGPEFENHCYRLKI